MRVFNNLRFTADVFKKNNGGFEKTPFVKDIMGILHLNNIEGEIVYSERNIINFETNSCFLGKEFDKYMNPKSQFYDYKIACKIVWEMRGESAVLYKTIRPTFNFHAGFSKNLINHLCLEQILKELILAEINGRNTTSFFKHNQIFFHKSDNINKTNKYFSKKKELIDIFKLEKIMIGTPHFNKKQLYGRFKPDMLIKFH